MNDWLKEMNDEDDARKAKLRTSGIQKSNNLRETEKYNRKIYLDKTRREKKQAKEDAILLKDAIKVNNSNAKAQHQLNSFGIAQQRRQDKIDRRQDKQDKKAARHINRALNN